jgi:hypothetical protein
MVHPWLFLRCREVEEEPDGCIDLWARGHGKTSIITVAGTIQEIMRNPEITIAIFSATKPLAQAILGQIKNAFESSEYLKEIFKDVLYENPLGKGPDGLFLSFHSSQACFYVRFFNDTHLRGDHSHDHVRLVRRYLTATAGRQNSVPSCRRIGNSFDAGQLELYCSRSLRRHDPAQQDAQHA